MWFRKKSVIQEPICIHAWHLIDARVSDEYNGINSDTVTYYTIGCVKCNRRREMDELKYSLLKQIITVKEDSE